MWPWREAGPPCARGAALLRSLWLPPVHIFQLSMVVDFFPGLLIKSASKLTFFKEQHVIDKGTELKAALKDSVLFSLGSF